MASQNPFPQLPPGGMNMPDPSVPDPRMAQTPPFVPRPGQQQNPILALLSNPGLIQALSQLAMARGGGRYGGYMAQGAQAGQQRQQEQVMKQQQMEATRKQQEAELRQLAEYQRRVLGQGQQRINLEKEQLVSSEDERQLRRDELMQQRAQQSVSAALDDFRSGLASIDTTDSSNVEALARQIVETHGLAPAAAERFVKSAMRVKVKPVEAKGLSAEIREAETALGRPLTTDEKRTLAGVAAQPSQGTASYQEYQLAAKDPAFKAWIKERANLTRNPIQFMLPPGVTQEQMDSTVKDLAQRVARNEMTPMQAVGMLPGGSRGGYGVRLMNELSATGNRVVPPEIKEKIVDIQKGKNLIAQAENIVDEIIAGKDVVQNTMLLENYTQSIGTLLARSLGERGVATNQDVTRATGLVPGWKSTNFLPGFARRELALLQAVMDAQERAYTEGYFAEVKMPGTGQQPETKQNPFRKEKK